MSQGDAPMETAVQRPTTKGMIKQLHDRRVAEEDKVRARRAMMNELRNALNLLAVFQEEYDVPEQDVAQLRATLEKAARLMRYA